MKAAAEMVPAVEVDYVSSNRVLYFFCSSECEQSFFGNADVAADKQQRLAVAVEDLPADCRCSCCEKVISDALAAESSAKKAQNRYNTPRKNPVGMSVATKILVCKNTWAMPGLDHYNSEENQRAVRGATGAAEPEQPIKEVKSVAPSVTEKVDHPAHYGGDTTYEVIKVLENWGLDKSFCLGNAVKYIARAGKKSADTLEDLRKSLWYLFREIANLEREATTK